MKKTIAILGNSEKITPIVMEVLVKQDLQLLIISEDKSYQNREQLNSLNCKAEIAFISCEREGCWEADIIAIILNGNNSNEIIQKIKEVATQKIVLIFSEENKNVDQVDFIKLLPYSRVLEIEINSQKKEFLVSGIEDDSILDIQAFLDIPNFTRNNLKEQYRG